MSCRNTCPCIPIRKSLRDTRCPGTGLPRFPLYTGWNLQTPPSGPGLSADPSLGTRWGVPVGVETGFPDGEGVGLRSFAAFESGK